MDDYYYSPTMPDETLLNSVFASLGISPEGVATFDVSDIEGAKMYGKLLKGQKYSEDIPKDILKMRRNFGQKYSEDEITTKALMDFYHKHSNLSSDELQKLAQSDEGQKEIEELKNKYKDQYPLFQKSDGNFYKPGEQISLSQRNDLANYFMSNINKNMHNLIHGTYYPDDATESVKKTSAVKDEFDELYNNILPKLLLIRKLKYIQTQKELMQQYGYDYSHLAQYLMNLIKETEKEMQQYLSKGILISPLMGQNYMKLYMNK